MAVERRTSAVSFYPTEHPALNLTVKSRLIAQLREMQENLASGLAADWADYRYRCGMMEGYRQAIAICEEVLREMSNNG